MSSASPTNIPKFLLKLVVVSVADKLLFIQELGVMMKAGVAIDQALKSLVYDTRNPQLQNIIYELKTDVESGISFSNSLSKHKNVFGEVFVSMVHAGEISGKLDESLRYLYIQMKKDHDIVSKARGALIYPAFILLAVIGVVSFLMIKVVPTLISTFKDAHVPLPKITQILIVASDTIVHNGGLVFASLVFLIIAMIIILKTYVGKYVWHTIKLRLPILGSIVKKINLARFARTFSALIRTDIPIVQDLQITANVLGSLPYRIALNKAAKNIENGFSLETSLRATPYLFPTTIVQLVNVGEVSGSLDAVLEEMAVFYEDDVTQTMNNLPSLIEPLLIVLLGTVVGGIALAIILPIYTIMQTYA